MSAAKSSRKIEHFVSKAPFDPYSIEALSPEQEKYYLASQWKLMWWKLRRHRLAVISGIVLIVLYVMAIFAEVFSPYNNEEHHPQQVLMPPQAIHFFHEGSLVGPFVYKMDRELDMERLIRVYTADTSKPYPIRFFCSGESYKFWGWFEADFHLVCPPHEASMHLLGTDRLGRDMLSRIIAGGRISLTIGLVGIAIAFALGMIIGGAAGYFGGWIDWIVQRSIEIIRSFPELPLWMALSAIIPVTWSQVAVYFGITVILALLEWTNLARAVRSKLLSLREEDYAQAAQLMGARPRRIIFRHLMPGFMSHLIASASLAIPTMVLAETALSFLGLGLRPPATSWGVLLIEAQNINAVAIFPWLMLPVVPVIIAILAFSFFGDGLRDAADPYK